jgi:hypothetical protein
VGGVASWSKQVLSRNAKVGILNSGGEGMLRVVAMLIGNMAGNAKIVIITRSASDKVLDSQFYTFVSKIPQLHRCFKTNLECKSCKYE